MKTDQHEFSDEDKIRALKLVDNLASEVSSHDAHIILAALGAVLTFTIVNAVDSHNRALTLVKHFTEQLVNAVDDAFQD